MRTKLSVLAAAVLLFRSDHTSTEADSVCSSVKCPPLLLCRIQQRGCSAAGCGAVSDGGKVNATEGRDMPKRQGCFHS